MKKYWIKGFIGNQEGRYKLTCPKCGHVKKMLFADKEDPKFCESCGRKLHMQNEGKKSSKKEEVEKEAEFNWIKENWGNHDGRYPITCPNCNFTKEIHPRLSETPPDFCPGCGKKMQ